jgi:methylenetetrahydrofolate dehydrogenase (NADP+) / methenyltetrahydrofolate cyclohydrolase
MSEATSNSAHERMANILSVTAWVPGLIKPEWIRPGACSIDVEVDREREDQRKKKKVAILRAGGRLSHAAEEIGGYLRPALRGLGTMTIVSLFVRNILQSLTYSLRMA